MKFIMKHLNTNHDLPNILVGRVRHVLQMNYSRRGGREGRGGGMKVTTVLMYLNKNIGRFGNINILLFLPDHMIFFVINYRIPINRTRLMVHPYHVSVKRQVCRLSNFLSASKKETARSKCFVDVYGFTWCQLDDGDIILPATASVRCVAADRSKFKMCTQRNISDTVYCTI